MRPACASRSCCGASATPPIRPTRARCWRSRSGCAAWCPPREYRLRMRALAAAGLGLLGALLLAQARPGTPARRARSRADGGTVLLGTDPPGRLRPAPPAADGGILGAADAGPDATQRQIGDLRARVDALEKQLAQSQQQGQQLQEIAAQMQQLRQQIADAEARRQAEEQQRAAQRQQLQSAIDGLTQAQYALAG